MTAEELLQVIDKEVNLCDELSLAFVGRVYEYLKRADSFMFTFSEESLSSSSYDLTEELWSLDSSCFRNTTCGLDEGSFGFEFIWDAAFFDSLEYQSETYLDEVASYSDYFSSGAELIKAIESLSGASKPLEDESLREIMFAEGGLWDTLCAVFPGYMDYIPQFAPDWVKCDLMRIIVAAWSDSYGDEMLSHQTVCAIKNPGLDKWISYLRTGVVSHVDRRRSRNVLGKLLSTDMSCDQYNTEISYYSYSEDSKALYRKRVEREETGKDFYMLLIQVADNGYFGGPIVSSIQGGVISPAMMANMFKVKEFLEEMEGKYHFLPENKEVETHEKVA